MLLRAQGQHPLPRHLLQHQEGQGHNKIIPKTNRQKPVPLDLFVTPGQSDGQHPVLPGPENSQDLLPGAGQGGGPSGAQGAAPS